MAELCRIGWIRTKKFSTVVAIVNIIVVDFMIIHLIIIMKEMKQTVAERERDFSNCAHNGATGAQIAPQTLCSSVCAAFCYSSMQTLETTIVVHLTALSLLLLLLSLLLGNKPQLADDGVR